MKSVNIIVGLGYGDEGKGRSVDYFAKKNPDSIVVRFNGGPQAGHTVIKDGHKHIFASFGSGTLQGCSTYWSSHCPFNALYFMNELSALQEIGMRPSYFISSDSPLIIRQDVIFNKALELSRGHIHGSCGMGIGAAIQRYEDHHRITVRDLLYPSVLNEKLELADKYYERKTTGLIGKFYKQLEDTESRLAYTSAFRDCKRYLQVVEEAEFLTNSKRRNFIFEGAQGIMLDMEHGFFPHVTRSHTTSKNALELIEKYALGTPVINYITRCYSTRHGEGPMTSETAEFKESLHNYELETNVHNDWQGNLRYGPLDLDALEYAVSCDKRYSSAYESRLIVTCLDQLKTRVIQAFKGESRVGTTVKGIAEILKAKSVLSSNSPLSEVAFK